MYNMGTFSGEATLLFTFLSPFSVGFSSKTKISKSRPPFGRASDVYVCLKMEVWVY